MEDDALSVTPPYASRTVRVSRARSLGTASVWRGGFRTAVEEKWTWPKNVLERGYRVKSRRKYHIVPAT
jgi:hypothetical protein